jgi:NhaP-type Na+/H+ or K+/H+ antiporter
MAATQLLLLVAGIIAIGVIAQLLSSRLQVPSIIFYIAAGLALGEPGLEILTAETFGSGLQTIVGIAVAIIVFEGAFHLKIERIKEAPQAAVRLVTVGALIALAGTAAAVKYAFGVPWNLALTIGALLVATGPTVVTPILDVVSVRDRVAAALETEGIVNDVTAAILAIVFF